MTNVEKISKRLNMKFLNWNGIITFSMKGWKMIPVKISSETLESNLKNKDINYIVKTIRKKIKNENKQWSILSNNILVVR